LIGENFMKTTQPGAAAQEFIQQLNPWSGKYVACEILKILQRF
jgi:hypothetical protein